MVEVEVFDEEKSEKDENENQITLKNPRSSLEKQEKKEINRLNPRTSLTSS
jgi:hypothetical protein